MVKQKYEKDFDSLKVIAGISNKELALSVYQLSRILMINQDIRWQQRFASYKKALLQLQNAVDLNQQRTLTQLEKQG